MDYFMLYSNLSISLIRLIYCRSHLVPNYVLILRITLLEKYGSSTQCKGCRLELGVVDTFTILHTCI